MGRKVFVSYKYKDNDQFAKELIACPEIVRCMTLPFDPIE